MIQAKTSLVDEKYKKKEKQRKRGRRKRSTRTRTRTHTQIRDGGKERKPEGIIVLTNVPLLTSGTHY